MVSSSAAECNNVCQEPQTVGRSETERGLRGEGPICQRATSGPEWVFHVNDIHSYMDTLTVGHPVFQGFSLSILNTDIYEMRLEGILAPSPVDITCASPSERAKGNAATTMMPQTATATSGSQIAMAHDTTTISQNGMRIRDKQGNIHK